MKKKMLCALALCAALSAGAAPVPQFDAPVASAAAADSFADASIHALPMMKRERRFLAGDEKGPLFLSRWTTVDFAGSGLGALANALVDFSAKEDQDAEAANAQITAEARQERDEQLANGSPFYGPFDRIRDVYVCRADSRVVSLMESVSSYTGGVHGMYGVLGQTFDAQTGKKLALSDVCPNKDRLIAAIVAHLGFDYPNAPFMQSGSTLVQEQVRQLVTDDVVPWTLGPQGLTVYLNPYVIGSYAEGIYTTTILFSQHPDLFAADYGVGPAAYAMELEPYHLVTRLSDSPRDHRLTVGGDENGITITFGGETITDSVVFKGMAIRPVVAQLADGRHYLYVDGFDNERGYRVIRVYDLNLPEPACIGVQPMTFLASPVEQENDRKWFVMTDPADFMAVSMEESALYPPGTQVRCRVGSDGRMEIISVADAKG